MWRRYPSRLFTPPRLFLGRRFSRPTTRMTGGGEMFGLGSRYTRPHLSRADFILGYTDFRAETLISEGKMQEFAKSDRPSKGGRRPFVPTRRQRDKATLLIAAGFPEPAIAIAIGCCQNTLRRYFATELENGRAIRRAQNLQRLERAAAAGSVGAMRILEGIFGRAETKQPGKDKAEARPSKRILAQRAAATAGGAGTPWGSDLDWSNGGRPQ